MNRYFVVGNPVSHSLSPAIHKAFAQQFGIEMTYEARAFEDNRFAEGMGALCLKEKPAGINVTVPFKLDAADYVKARAILAN